MKTTLILIIMGTPIFAFAQKNVEVDSTEIILNLLKKEYMPFEKISFNKGKIYKNVEVSKLNHFMKIEIKSVTECVEIDECSTFDRYFFSTKTWADYASYEDGTRVLGKFKIEDKSLLFDYYPKMFVGADVGALKQYFPITFKYSYLKYLPKYLKNKQKKHLFVIGVEWYKGAYPNDMGYMTLGIEVDLKTKKILSFEFFDQDQ